MFKAFSGKKNAGARAITREPSSIGKCGTDTFNRLLC
jgi:hypothetical protein